MDTFIRGVWHGTMGTARWSMTEEWDLQRVTQCVLWQGTTQVSEQKKKNENTVQNYFKDKVQGSRIKN